MKKGIQERVSTLGHMIFDNAYSLLISRDFIDSFSNRNVLVGSPLYDFHHSLLDKQN